MNDEFDKRLKKAVEKHVQKANQEADRRLRNGIASRTREQQRKDFHVDFLAKCDAVIAPMLRRIEDELERAVVASAPSDEIAGARRVANCRVLFDDEDQIELEISHEGKTAKLSFRADTQAMKVVVHRSDGGIDAQLDLQQVIAVNIEPLVIGFVETALGVPLAFLGT